MLVACAHPQAANMLLAALPNYAGQPLVPPSKDPVQFVQQLHSHILSAVLPLWSHPKAAYAPAGVLTAMIRVLQTCSAGPSHASLVLRYQQQGRPVQRVQPAPDPQMVTTITEMGFSQARAEEALRRVGANSVELAMEWLISHPEEPAAPAAAGGAAAGGAAAAAGGAAAAGAAAPVVDEEEELTRALLASLSVVGMSPDTVAQRSQQQQRQQQQEQEQEQESQPPPAGAADGSPTAAQATSAEEVTTPQATQRPLVQPGAPMPRGAAAAASAASSSHTADSPSSAGTGIPAPAQLVDGAVRLVAASPSTAFSIADLLLTIAQREEGKGREALVGRLMDACLPPAPAADPAAASSSAAAAAVFPPPGGDVLTPARLLLLLLTKDGSSRKVAAKLGLVARSLLQLEQWQVGYRADVEAYERGPAQQGQSADADAAAAVRKLEVPVWVEASLMLLDLMVTTTLRTGSTNPAAAAAARVAAARAAVAAAAEALPRPAAAAAAAPEAAAADAGAAAAPAAAGVDVQMEDQPGAAAPAPAEADAAAAPAAEEASTPQTTPRPVVQPGAPTLGMAPAAAAVGTAVLDTPPPNLAASAAADAAGIKLPAELSQLSGLARVLAGWRPCGLLDDAQQRAATSLCLALLQQLHDHADKWEQPATSMFQADGSLPNPSSVTQALLQLLAHLTKRHSNAQQVSKGPAAWQEPCAWHLLAELTVEIVLPASSRQAAQPRLYNAHGCHHITGEVPVQAAHGVCVCSPAAATALPLHAEHHVLPCFACCSAGACCWRAPAAAVAAVGVSVACHQPPRGVHRVHAAPPAGGPCHAGGLDGERDQKHHDHEGRHARPIHWPSLPLQPGQPLVKVGGVCGKPGTSGQARVAVRRLQHACA
jgi:hypothetical protein